MTIQIDRYKIILYPNGRGEILDLLHNEIIVEITSRNRKLPRELLTRCLEYLNTGEMSNDKEKRF